MQEVKLGRTGLVVPKNSFGALPIQRVGMAEAVYLLQKAFYNGFTYFDTARAYTDSEKKLGEAFRHTRSRIIISTKTGSSTADGFWRDLETSLEQLGTDYIDIYQFHNPAFCPKPGDESGLYDAALEAKRQGKIRFIGITNHRLAVAREAIESGLYDTLQFPFCYLASDDDLELVRMCAERDMGFIAMKALSGGLITDSAAAYAYIAQFPGVVPIWGVQRESELDEFISYNSAPPSMTAEMQAKIEADRKELVGDFCRSCGYCMPCPAGIQISQVARMSQLLRRSPTEGFLSEYWQAEMKKVENCLNCGACMKKCPYGLNTPELIRKNYEDYKTFLK